MCEVYVISIFLRNHGTTKKWNVILNKLLTTNAKRKKVKEPRKLYWKYLNEASAMKKQRKWNNCEISLFWTNLIYSNCYQLIYLSSFQLNLCWNTATASQTQRYHDMRFIEQLWFLQIQKTIFFPIFLRFHLIKVFILFFWVAERL